MTTDVHRVTLDPHVEGEAHLPNVPSSGLVLVSVPPGDSEACGRGLLDLARGWRDGGRRVFLCDACFEAPFLHAAAGSPNGEGLSDSLLYGTTFGRISHRIETDLAVAPAGTVVGDPDGVRRHDRWTTILTGFEEAGALFVVAVPTGAEGGPLADAAVLRVAFEAEEPETDESSRPVVDIAALAPDAPEPVPEPPTHDVPPLEETSAGARVTVTDEVASERGVENTLPDADPDVDVDDVPGGEGAPKDDGDTRAAADTAPREPDAPKRSLPYAKGVPIRTRRASRLPLLLLVLILAVLLLGWFGVVEIPGVTPADVDLPSFFLPHR